MVEIEHTLLFLLWYTSINNLFRTVLEEIRFFPEEVPNLGKEAILVLLYPFSG